jgi:hypothetical protein
MSVVGKLRSAGLREGTRLVYRKLIYRRTSLQRFEVRAGNSVAPRSAAGIRFDVLNGDAIQEIFGTNPHLADEDVDRFRLGDATCIVAREGSELAASTWMIRGAVYISELQRNVSLARGEHYSCRSYVDPRFRGRALLANMIHTYCTTLPADDVVWGLVYEWNTASIASLRSIGWQRTGDLWTTNVLGFRLAGGRTPAAPSDGSAAIP